MITITCTYTNGDTITTRFNGTFEEAKKYFLNRVFNIGSIRDNLQKCIDVAEA